MEILTVGYLPTFNFRKEADNYEEKRFINLIFNYYYLLIN